MKRKVLSAALAATLMLSSVAPSFAEEVSHFNEQLKLS